jgi:hypothetical protein
MSAKHKSILLDTQRLNEAAKIPGVKSRAKTAPAAIDDGVVLQRFKDLMRKNAGKLRFAGHAG